MTQATPTQELVAKDLHGFEWKFKHIFRGNFLFLYSKSSLKIYAFASCSNFGVNECHDLT